ncbi:MAG: hypothetical protein WHU10_06980 [Fimbriimonadales bacterium]
MIRTLSILGWAALVVLAAGFFVERHLASKAMLAQRVRLPDSNVEALFGGEPTPIGSPQMYVILDPRALLPEKGPDGVARLDDGYLQRTGTYPLQLKTVEFVGGIVRWASAGLAGLCLGNAWYLSRRRARLLRQSELSRSGAAGAPPAGL